MDLEEWDLEEWATGGGGPVIQEPVDTGNAHLDKAINNMSLLCATISSKV